MTSSETPDRLRPGVYTIRDTSIGRAVAALIGPLLTDPDTEARRDAAPTSGTADRERIAHLEAEAAQTQGLLAQAISRLEGAGETLRVEQDAHTATKARLADARAANSRAQADTARAHAERRAVQEHLDNTTAELTDAKAAANTPKPRRAPELEALELAAADRARDRNAFASLARRMEDQAKAKPKQVGDILRIAARGVRDEVDAVYGAQTKAAS